MDTGQRHILLNVEAFPATFRDVDLGVYFIECKVPDYSMDVAKTQVLLDNNLLGITTRNPDAVIQKISWYFGQHPQADISLNPAVAATEQYLSNDWDNAKTHLEAFEKAVAKFRIFEAGHMLNLLRTVAGKEADTMQQVGILFCYLTVLKHLYAEKPEKGGDLLNTWVELFRQDIPRIQTIYMFGSLFLLSRMQRQLRFARQESLIAEYADKFMALRKKEKGDFTRWLRNRACDILPFILAPTLSIEKYGGYSSRVVIATNDEVVGECIGRLFAWGGEQQKNDRWTLVPMFHVLDQRDERVCQGIEQIYQGIASERASNDEEKKLRLRNLIQISMEMVGVDLRAHLHQALSAYRIYDMLV
ncbi:MAG: hypothetical protein VR70_11160 [Rhodospirillaceae bacterium BRH_c57]|nr:MAG: hypothetical protein VR70_11160 [Rhodospirillaceae bacterium BRH_c57]